MTLSPFKNALSEAEVVKMSVKGKIFGKKATKVPRA